MAIYPYAGSGYDKYWKYENPDASTNHYSTRVALEILDEIQGKIRKRGKQIYGVRSEAIIVQDLVHGVIRELAKMLAEHVKLIEKYEQENSGDIQNYFGSEEEDQEGRIRKSKNRRRRRRSTRKNDLHSFRSK